MEMEMGEPRRAEGRVVEWSWGESRIGFSGGFGFRDPNLENALPL